MHRVGLQHSCMMPKTGESCYGWAGEPQSDLQCAFRGSSDEWLAAEALRGRYGTANSHPPIQRDPFLLPTWKSVDRR